MTASDHLKHRTGSLGGDQDGEIEVIDRADGAAGSWCIRKIVPGNTAWYWNKGKWAAFAQVFKHDKETADCIAKAEAALAQKTRECEELRDWYNHQITIVNKRNSELEAQVEQLGRQVAEMSAGNFKRHSDCAHVCQYAKDIDMQEHSCQEKCVYLERKAASKERPIYSKFRVNQNTETTPIFGISCDEGWRESVVCTGMYEYTIDWLLPILQHRPYCPTFEPRPECTCKFLGGGRGNGDVFFPARFELNESCPRHSRSKPLR